MSTPKANTTNISNVNGDTNDQLQAQVENYKKVLGETVSVFFVVLSKSFLVSNLKRCWLLIVINGGLLLLNIFIGKNATSASVQSGDRRISMEESVV